jgi:hypothetical protein
MHAYTGVPVKNRSEKIMISKEIINAGLTKFFPVVVLKDERDQEVIMDRDDYLPFGSDEGDGKTPSFRWGMESSLII